MKKEWVVVADGSMAKILKPENYSLIHVFPTYHANEMVTTLDEDPRRFGRVHSHGLIRHASPHEDYEDREKKEFIKKISDIISDNLAQYDCLIIIAHAKRLKEIQTYLTAAAKEKVTHKISKDLVKAPLEEIYKYVVKLPYPKHQNESGL